MAKVINYNCRGEIIADMSKVVIKHDEHPLIWMDVARIVKEGTLNDQRGRAEDNRIRA